MMNQTTEVWLEFARKVHAIAETGLTFNKNEYDLERYEQLKQISYEMLGQMGNTSPEVVKDLFAHQKGYQTPKVDVRAVIVEDNKILMVQEKVDRRWTLPGGWADVGLTPFENAVKETWEESGLKVEPVRLLSVMDKKCYPHPPTPWYCYKMFVLCKPVGGELKAGMETLDTAFYDRENLPPLSEERITKEQIDIIYRMLEDGNVWCD
ncbi:MAG TPA: NUDIX hydrolase [Bacteroidales bacterium]|nr:NUDIX hydrolase [Bacteroidales bacterium]